MPVDTGRPQARTGASDSDSELGPLAGTGSPRYIPDRSVEVSPNSTLICCASALRPAGAFINTDPGRAPLSRGLIRRTLVKGVRGQPVGFKFAA